MNADFYKLVRTLDGLKEDPTGTKQLENGKSLLKESEEVLKEKAVSQAQQKFMGMVHAAQKGEKPASPEVAKVAKDMSHKAAKDYASTKHKGLPKKVKEGEVWRPGMTPPPNPDMGSSLTPGEQKRVVTPQGPEGVQQPYLPSQPKKPAPAAPSTAPKKTSELDVDTQIAETSLEEYGYGSTFFVVAPGNKPEMFTNQKDAMQRQQAYAKQGKTANIHLNSPEGKIIASSDESMRAKDMERIAAYRANRQTEIDNELDSYLQYKRQQSIKKGQQAAKDRADAEVYQLGAGRRINPTDPEDKLGMSGIVKNLEMQEGNKEQKVKKSDRLPIYQESTRYKTINNLIREEFDLDDLDQNGLSLEEKDIKAALGDQLFNELQAVKNGEADISENLKDALFNYYKNSGELPPEIRQDENDVSEYIADKINSMKTNDSSDRLSVSEDRKVSGTRYGGGAQQDDEEEGEGTDKKTAQPEVKRGRGRPPKAGSQSTNPEEKRKQKDREEAGKALQSMIVGNQPKKSKSLEKLPTTKHKMKG